MDARSRRLYLAGCALTVAAGVVCAVLVPGLAGELLTLVLIALGLGGAVVLVFLEVGFSEERELARDEKRRERAQRTFDPRPRFPRRRSH
jgi:hypothetical protein